jgi:putative transposase
MIYKTIFIPLKCKKADYEYLSRCNILSAEVWNNCLEIENQYRKENDGKWITPSELQKATKQCVHLHSKGIQHVLNKYLHARDSALNAKKGNGSNNKYPHRRKQFFVTGWTYQDIRVHRNYLLLQKPMTKEKIDGRIRRQKPAKVFLKNIPDNIVQVELIYKNKLYLCIKYKEEIQPLQIKSNNHAAIDLGEIHAITSIDTCGNAIIITGRKLRAIKQHRNKQQGKLYARLSKCQKGSRQYWKYRDALKNLKFNHNKKINDAVHKITKCYVDYCLVNNISTVYFGDLDSATRNTKKNKKGNSHVRQKLAQWNYGAIVKQLENKLSRHGIRMLKVKEYYTSQKCPSCKELNKPKNRKYYCSCGYVQHRDIVGSINILNDNLGSELTHYRNKMYLRIA